MKLSRRSAIYLYRYIFIVLGRLKNKKNLKGVQPNQNVNHDLLGFPDEFQKYANS